MFIKPLILLAIIFVAAALYLLAIQHGMIYFPRQYDSGYEPLSSPEIKLLDYETSQGAQVAFYVPPNGTETEIPKRLWVMFGGNASLALDWLGTIKRARREGEGFLLIDYPGYGKSSGSASPQNILESSEKAVRELAAFLKAAPSSLEGRISIVGHSLGAGAGLKFAVNHVTEYLILIAPFTSMLDMAVKTVGYPFCYLLQHRFDNRAQIAQLLERQEKPKIVIIHGDDDGVVPVEMGRELYSIDPEKIEYIEAPGLDHSDVLDAVELYLSQIESN